MADLLFVLVLVEVLCDLDLDIAEVPLAGNTLSLLLVRVRRFLGARWSAFQSTVPIVRYESLALVPLGRAMRIDVVDMRKVCLEPAKCQ